MPEKIIFTEENEKKIVELYQDGLSCPKIGKLFKCSKQTINAVLTKNNISFRSMSEANRRYSINENIFEIIDTHEKAYWLGMLMGDGCVYKGDLTLSLQEKDKEYVYRFRDFMGTERPIHIAHNRPKNDGTESISYMFTITNKKLISDLSKYNIVPNKTYGAKFPNTIPDQYLSSYILGLIDSDGCICLKEKPSNKGGKSLSFSFVGPTEFVEELQIILINKCGVNKTKLDIQKNTPFIRIVCYGGYKNVFKIIKYIYSNSSIFFVRKKKIAIDFLLTRYPDDEWLLSNKC